MSRGPVEAHQAGVKTSDSAGSANVRVGLEEATDNLKRHGVSFEETATTFRDPLAKILTPTAQRPNIARSLWATRL